MPEVKENSATRLLRAAEHAKRIAKNRSGLEVWAAAFNLAETLHPVDKEKVTSDFLSRALDELKAIDGALGAMGVPDDLFKQYISNCRTAFSVGSLHQGWSSFSGAHLGDGTLVALKWMAYTLDADGVTASAASLAELTEALDTLEALAGGNGIPRVLASLIRRHASNLREAIAMSAIQGTSVIRKAERAMLADIHIDADEIKQAATTGEPEAVKSALLLLEKTWRTAANIAGDAEKLRKGVRVLSDVVGAIAGLAGPD